MYFIIIFCASFAVVQDSHTITEQECFFHAFSEPAFFFRSYFQSIHNQFNCVFLVACKTDLFIEPFYFSVYSGSNEALRGPLFKLLPIFSFSLLYHRSKDKTKFIQSVKVGKISNLFRILGGNSCSTLWTVGLAQTREEKTVMVVNLSDSAHC